MALAREKLTDNRGPAHAVACRCVNILCHHDTCAANNAQPTLYSIILDFFLSSGGSSSAFTRALSLRKFVSNASQVTASCTLANVSSACGLSHNVAARFGILSAVFAPSQVCCRFPGRARLLEYFVVGDSSRRKNICCSLHLCLLLAYYASFADVRACPAACSGSGRTIY